MEPKKKLWVEQLTGANADPEGAKNRAAILDGAAESIEQQREKIRDGMKFSMDVLADGRFTKFMQSLGMSPDKMQALSGDGDFEKEIDTHHDLKNLKAISGPELVKAVESLKIVSDVSEKTRAELSAQRYKEAGYPPEKRKALEEALKNRKSNGKDGGKPGEGSVPKDGEPASEELDKFKTDSEKIDDEVDESVAEEVWTPLVRQGVMPENLVPDRFSNVKRTFKGAADAYQERLEEYSKDLDDNANVLAKLGVAKELTTQCIDLANSVVKLVPGAEGVTDHIDKAAKLLSIASTTGFTAAEQVIQKKDAQDIVNTIAGGVASICGGAIPDPTIAKIVSGSIQGAVKAGRAVRAIVDRKPDAFLDALSAAVNSALTSAAVATGNQTLKDLTPMIVGTIKNSGQAAAFVKTCKDGDPAKIKDALGKLVNSGLDTVAQWVKYAVAETHKDKSEDVDKAVDLAVTGSKALITAAASDKGKVAAFAGALGTIANGACSSYMKPPDLGKSVGALINSGLGSAGPGLIDGIKKKDPAAVIKSIQEVVGKSLATAAAGVESEAVQKKIETAAKLVDAWMAALGSTAVLSKAIQEQKYDDINKAAKSVFQDVGNYISESLKAAGLEGAKEDEDDAEGEAEKSGDGESAKSDNAEDDEAAEAKKQDAATVKKLKAQIEAQNKILADSKATPEEKEAAANERAKAVNELKEQKQMKNELAQDAGQFAAMLSLGVADDDPDDDGTPPPKIQNLILQLQKDRQIFDLVESLSGMPLEVAAKFFPPMGAAVDFKKFSFEVVRAVQHTRQLLQWMDNAADAKAAVTVQVHAMLSRIHMEKRQVLEHNSKAALALIAGIGQIVAVVGAHAAPVGVALTAGARAGEAGLAIIKKIVDETEMEAGWQNFKAAIDNPKDRKNARAAIQSNPTLAKYCLAWGALHGGDPIAKEALRKCGLTDAVLQQEDS